MEKALVYFAAGISSRFNGKTKALQQISKNMSLIEYSLNQALKNKFSKIIFIVSKKTKKDLKKKFKNSYKQTPVFYALQKYNKKKRNRPWGTVDALCSAKKHLNCPFIICNGDDIYGASSFKTLFNHLKEKNEEAVISYKINNVLPKTGTVNRGIIKQEEEYVKSIKDKFNISKKDLSKIKQAVCSMNLYALHPETISLLKKDLKTFKKQHKKDRDIELRLPHALSKLIKTKEIKIKIYPTKEHWVGITNPGDEIKARKLIKKYYKRK